MSPAGWWWYSACIASQRILEACCNSGSRMNLPVMVSQSGWRPSAISASSARTALRVVCDVGFAWGMALAF
jgi:hypothetical protein